MKRFLPRTFRFSLVTNLICFTLAALMLRASAWQWERYNQKVKLLESYGMNSGSEPLAFPEDGTTAEAFAGVLHRKVLLSGTYDFERQVIVTNRKHASGPGHWLLTPLRLAPTADGKERYVLVSRGFIPFADHTPESWKKYDEPAAVTIQGVVQPTVPERSFLSPSRPGIEQGEFPRKWLFPDLEKLRGHYPYEIITPVFLQRLGGPAQGTFPAESVSIEVPPSTHFGYTIEWILLAIATIFIGFLIQANPWRDRQRGGVLAGRSLNGARGAA